MNTPAGIERPTTFREAVAEEIRAALARRRMSASALARTLGKSQTYVWRRLSGETAFDTDDLEAIAGALDVPVVELLPIAVRQGMRVSGTKQRPTVCTDPVKPNVLPHVSDGSPARADQHRRPRRPLRAHQPVPIMQSAAA